MSSYFVNNGWKNHNLLGFLGKVGVLWTRRESDTWAYGMETTIDHTNPAGIVHGGLICTLLDHALSTIAWESAGRIPCVTQQMDTHFLRPARPGEYLECRARSLQQIKRTIFLQGVLSSGTQEIATATGIWIVLPTSPKTSQAHQ
jgi:uncharacterized protein (TIGR00369 family)